MENRPVKILSAEVARKIAAGEVIDRPASIIRELLDNSVDSGAKNISVELKSGGIESIRVVDDGCGLTKEDLTVCARPHATSKITSDTDLLNLSTLGFRGEALASIAAVCRLSITSGQWNMKASIVEDHIITPCTPVKGTIICAEGIFENFPARRVFLKRPASEGSACKQMFLEKALPRPDISFRLKSDGKDIFFLPQNQSLIERFVKAYSFSEPVELFHELSAEDSSETSGKKDWSFKLVIGSPDVNRQSKKDIYIYVNGHRIQEYSLLQAIEFGCQGFFPNGTHPAAALFVEMNPNLIDFNIHPAKREVKFKDSSSLHHGISSTVRAFFKQYTLKELSSIELEQSIFPTELGKVEKDYAEPVFRNNSIHSSNSSRPTYAMSSIKDVGTNRLYPRMSPSSLNIPSISKLASIAHSPESYIETSENIIEDTFRYIGAVLGTFLIAEKNNTLYIIDQHAAHERILFNAIMENAGQKQPLLVPLTLETQSVDEDKYLESVKDKLKEAGFEVEKKDDGEWLIKSIPFRYKGNAKTFYDDIIKKRIEPSQILYSVAASTACRAAVMDGDIVSADKAREIARRALELTDPHCPHGRPIFHKITREELFAFVKRT